MAGWGLAPGAAGGREALRAHLLDLATGQARLTVKAHGEYLTCAGISPDGQILATGSADETVRLWDPRDGRQRRALAGLTKGSRAGWQNAVCRPRPR